ncbi:Protein of unknown function [Alkalithermobacter thermoalcaliphilus JW-YL-7 = DSM 7308]|uniref:DUF1659 domain-containing protein n=1 Tax=Alkalithermobacter thermoalcaliphilus JW-YL-7 = DSM 7308 TaxID=1121328 RepID=A0A150FSK3_CLOPD|nr:protein of unknown function DUF1659 [[Clostridium] paradoxum JW-YL-7 = DSM 7308]SHK70727.1 Protein of unknown function [[Clostridium] paradoxum JW-YL-7 = DSM 7308]
MPVNSIKTETSLRLRYSLGLDQNGIEKFQTKTIRNFRVNILDNDLYQFADMLSNLQENFLVSVNRIDNSILSE